MPLHTATRPPLFITLAYCAFAGLWIAVSDRVIEKLFRDPDTLIVAGTYKGLAFVGVTAVLLYVALLRRELRHRDIRRTLLDSEARFRATFEQAAVGIAHVGIDGRWLRVNQTLCTIVGYPRNELLQMSYQDITHPDDLAPDLAHVQKLLAGHEESYQMQKRYLPKSGGFVWAELTVSLVRAADGVPDYFISVVEDISERKAAEAKLQRSERNYHELFAANPNPMWVFDLEALAFLDVNDAAIYRYGYSREEFLQMTIMDIHVPEENERLRDAIARTDSGYAALGAWRHRRKDGTEMLVEINSHPILFAGRQAMATLAHDVTAQRQAEQALNVAMDRLRTLSTRLIDAQENERRNVSRELHDEIGQSLTAIKIMLQTMKRNPGGGLDQLGEAIVIADRALDQVRDLSRMLRPSHLDDLGLVTALRSLSDRLSRSTGLDIQVIASSDTERLPGGIETACFRVAQEALTNVMRHAQASRVDLTVQPAPDGVRLQVRDNGQGFDADAALAVAGRVSMGLLSMQERAQLAGGRLTIQSVPGTGTTVDLWLPRQAQA